MMEKMFSSFEGKDVFWYVVVGTLEMSVLALNRNVFTFYNGHFFISVYIFFLVSPDSTILFNLEISTYRKVHRECFTILTEFSSYNFRTSSSLKSWFISSKNSVLLVDILIFTKPLSFYKQVFFYFSYYITCI